MRASSNKLKPIEPLCNLDAHSKYGQAEALDPNKRKQPLLGTNVDYELNYGSDASYNNKETEEAETST